MRVSCAMLHQFLTANRTELIDRCRLKVAQRSAPRVTQAELEYGVPLFLDQLIKTLRTEQTSMPVRNPGKPDKREEQPGSTEIGVSAALHGRELLKQGFTVDQVVHDYGDVCQAVTGLAFEQGAKIQVDEFRTLNRCLDNAIADAVTEFAFRRDSKMVGKDVQAVNERLGSLAHELRNLIHTATLAVTAIKSGNVGLTGATGAVLDRSLIGMRNLIDRSLADVRVTAGLPARTQRISLADFFADVEVSASLEAGAYECDFTVSEVDKGIAVDVDRDMLLSAVGNLLQNAFKFTGHHTEVTLSVHTTSDRVLIEVADHCGGLPPGAPEKMFLPFKQNGEEKSGLGLGLAICRRSVEANKGVLKVRDVPGTGCVFTIDLPRHALK
jgi:signal transduction histidine kinase